MTYSIIVAVYNRPDEMDELLQSLAVQTCTDFEVVVVEDGSDRTSEAVCQRYADFLTLSYHMKPNSGPGTSRNFGCERAAGSVFIFLDSDVMVPPDWLRSIDEARTAALRDGRPMDAFGGPDREHPDFSNMQKAISYAMTSIFTTGGIRGGKVRVGGAFHPRSFNMGITREVFQRTGGFSTMRFGEDVDLSMRIVEAGFSSELIRDAWVYHKRRTDLKKFYKQVFNSGNARINLSLRHPGTLKVTHFFPAVFTTYVVVAGLYTVFIPYGQWSLIPLALYFSVIFLDATVRNRSVAVGALSVAASCVQLIGYGLGFITGIWNRHVLGRPESHAFVRNFYS